MTASSLIPHGLRLISPRVLPHPIYLAFRRSISLNSAINRGIRRSDKAPERSKPSSRGRDGRAHERSENRRDRRTDVPPSRGSLRGKERPITRSPWDNEANDSSSAFQSSPGDSRAQRMPRSRNTTAPWETRGRRRTDISSGPVRGKERPMSSKRRDDSGFPKSRHDKSSGFSGGSKRMTTPSQDLFDALQAMGGAWNNDVPSGSGSVKDIKHMTRQHQRGGNDDNGFLDSTTHERSSGGSSSRGGSQRMPPRSRDPINDDTAGAEEDSAYWSKPPKMPISVPYTTSASEFLYGTSVVMAALRSHRRRLYKLYMLEAENRMRPGRDREMEKLARDAGVDVERVRGEEAERLLDKMSTGRPHNGYVLEASPLPRLPVTGFERVSSPAAKSFHVGLEHQSKEEQEINGLNPVISCAEKGGARYPFVLMLDGILDPGNLGNILRSAYFFGVDAIAICARNSAPVSPVALKASVGSSEYIPLVSVNDPDKFMDSTSRNGWKFYAAVAPPGPDTSPAHFPTSSKPKAKYISTDKLRFPLAKQPCILMIGGEGEGLRWNLRKKADQEIGIEGNSNRKGNVDSLNASVAAGLLCEAFVRGDSLEGLKEEREREKERLF